MRDTTKKDLRSRLSAIRHRIPELLADRTRHVALGAATLAVAGLSAAGVTATGSQDPVATTASIAGHGLVDRQDADRADRAGRSAAPGATDKGATANAGAPKKKSQAAAWVTPMDSAPVTSCYGPRGGTQHAGIDYALPPGTPVRSIGSGTVLAAGWVYTGYGKSVVVNHGNGYLTHYAHLSDTAVKPGQRVSAGTTLGHEGSTGDSSGPHLHFEVHKGMWNQVDPAKWLRAKGVDPGGC